jgi:hypothetical protein
LVVDAARRFNVLIDFLEALRACANPCNLQRCLIVRGVLSHLGIAVDIRQLY